MTERAPIGGHPGQLAVTDGGIWMADFRDGVLWRYQPAPAGSSASRRTASRATSRRSAARSTSRRTGGSCRAIVSRYDAATGVREESIDLLACALASGQGVLWAAGCPYVQRLRTGDGRLRKLVEVFLPFRTPASVEVSRVQFRELAVGGGSLWVLGDALDRRMWRLDARTGQIEDTIELGFPPTSVAVAGGAAWITDGMGDRVVPFDLARGALLAPCPSAAARAASPPGRARSGW